MNKLKITDFKVSSFPTSGSVRGGVYTHYEACYSQEINCPTEALRCQVGS
ncbi:hypothetical protein AB9P05_03785 [Roseivirga sp. BDSF3-8]